MSNSLINKDAKKSSEFYINANDLYTKINKSFEDIESGKISYKLDKFKFIKLQNDIKSLKSMLLKINLDSLEYMAGSQVVKTVEQNITFMLESIEYFQKQLMAYQYADDLYVPIRHYFKQMAENPENYKSWADDEEQLTKKFIGMLTHPNFIDTYKNQIRRMALGTMSLREFKKIYGAIKHKMIPNAKKPTNKFQSFDEYKNT